MRRIARYLALAIVGLISAVTAGTIIPRPIWPVAEAGDELSTRRILVLTNPIHTDIAVPIDAGVRARFPFLKEAGIPVDHPDARWIVFGWGGRAFYLETPTWSELKPLPVLKALTIDGSVMHVDVAGHIAGSHPAATGFNIGEAAFDRLIEHIADSFEENGPVPIEGAGYGLNDRFFAAKGYFNAFAGCNTWTAGALREAGLRTGLWNPLPASLAISLDIYN